MFNWIQGIIGSFTYPAIKNQCSSKSLYLPVFISNSDFITLLLTLVYTISKYFQNPKLSLINSKAR